MLNHPTVYRRHVSYPSVRTSDVALLHSRNRRLTCRILILREETPFQVSSNSSSFSISLQTVNLFFISFSIYSFYPLSISFVCDTQFCFATKVFRYRTGNVWTWEKRTPSYLTKKSLSLITHEEPRFKFSQNRSIIYLQESRMH